ncbi:MAG: LysM peptidoglycan-binding domain-containing protein [Verrucomicrobia bacterium]|nr:LysM peptidoglycan-binding domain-containing protein [Verrucomicrobiota bacterium]
MPQPQQLAKAEFVELIGGSNGQPASEGKTVPVQFNPQSLKLNFSNQWSGGDQPQGSSPQFVGTSTTKLSMELWFDVTLPIPDAMPDPGGDVRRMTQQVAYFMTVQNPNDPNQQARVPPKVRFRWGSFVFNGTMESMDETVELFSNDGVPLRASVSVNLSKHDLAFEFNQQQRGGSTPGIAGTTPLSLAKAGDSLQQMAARAGISNWQGVARANGITNPRQLQPGALINLSVSVSS